MRSLQVLACLSGLHQLSTAYNTPAPPDATRPNLFAYLLNWTPANPVHGIFGDRNNSVAPWHPEPHRPPHYPPHQQCDASSPGAQSDFWLPNVPHNGTSPFLLNAPNYHIYRNVRDFGAVGDGVHDDTDAFNAAIDCTYPRQIRRFTAHSFQMVVDVLGASVTVGLLENLPSYMCRREHTPSTPPSSFTSILRLSGMPSNYPLLKLPRAL